MVLEQNSFWMPRDSGCLANSEMAYSSSSRVESKRGRQWFLDPNGTELLSNKKQVTEAVNSRPMSGLSVVDVSPWDNNTSSFQQVPGQFTNHLFGSELESIPTVNLVDISDSYVSNVNMSMGRKDFEDQFLNNPSVSLSMTHAAEDPLRLSFGGMRKVKDNDCFIVTSQNYSNGDESNLFIDSSYNMESDNIILTGQAYGKLDLGIAPIGSTYDKEDSHIMSISRTHFKDYSNTDSFGGLHDEQGINRSGGINISYDLLTSSQNASQSSEEPDQNDLVKSNVEPVIDNTQKLNPRGDIASKNKEPKTSKKLPPNNFPANVKSLLSTGMLDGVRVKYVSWSREKTLHGIIKGSGYICGCEYCQLSKALNAYEFERHAGCKTKHPNNHIYLENGKTIYSVVQELKNTSQEALFDAIQNVTGTSINQKNFLTWKASFQAATLELQRIYGKEGVVAPS